MAAREAASAQSYAAHDAVHVNRLAGVLGARRNESACPPQKGGKQQLVQPNQSERDTGRWSHGFDWTRNRFRADWNS
jgi:hypothetical protein